MEKKPNSIGLSLDRINFILNKALKNYYKNTFLIILKVIRAYIYTYTTSA